MTSCSSTTMFPKSWGYGPILLYPKDHLDMTGQDVEICVPFEVLDKVQEAFNSEEEVTIEFDDTLHIFK